MSVAIGSPLGLAACLFVLYWRDEANPSVNFSGLSAKTAETGQVAASFAQVYNPDNH
jgi:hypothetical protein